ncbi:MAG: porin [Undibacterium sp.]|nr:porin [Undibacterium sp.]
MKKSILALALLSATSGAALAQSSVTIYGILDAGVAYKDAGAGSVRSLDSGLNSTSRLGFKGSEALSGGLKANFNLEMGLKSDTGANDANLFARGAWVGLSSDDFGAVNLGKHKSLTYVYGAQIDPFADGLLGKTDLMFKINTVRDNSITYISNSFGGGFSGAAQYGFGEAAGNATANRVTSIAGAYANGPLMANIVWDQTKDAKGNQALAAKETGDRLLAGISYDFGKDFYNVKLHAMYEEISGAPIDVKKDTRETKEQLYVVGASIKDGASTYMMSYTNSDVKTIVKSNSNRIALGYTYNLSTRTNLYTSLARVSNEANVKTLADANGATARLFNVGIRHKF